MVETIGVFEAKNHFSELLERVQKGETVTITKHGKPVAEIRPATPTFDVEKRRQAVAAMRELRDDLQRRGVVFTRNEIVSDLRAARDERTDRVLTSIPRQDA